MSFEERVEFWMTVFGLSREDAERRAALETTRPDLEPAAATQQVADFWGLDS